MMHLPGHPSLMLERKEFGQGKRWLEGLIESITGPVSFRVQIEGGDVRRCHQYQLRHRYSSSPDQSKQDKVLTGGSSRNNVDPIPATAEDLSEEGQPPLQESQLSEAPETVTQKHVRKPPDRYEPGFLHM